MIKLVKSSFYHEAETKQALAGFILQQDILSMSDQCREFEKAFAAKQQRKHAVFVNNGSVANFLLIQSLLNLGIFKRGDRIGFSALTWPTNVMPLIQLGLEPVPIDCNLSTLNVSPDILEAKIKGLQGMFLTNVLGFCDDIRGIRDLCDKNDVTLIEDNCEALGSNSNNTLLGNFGLASTFSFFVGHHMSTIEGGMVCTDDDDLYHFLVMSRAHGWDRNLSFEKQQSLRTQHQVDEFYSKYTFYDLASNFRPTEINGFLGNSQLKFWDEIVAKREQNFKRFVAKLNANPDFVELNLSHMNQVSNFAMPVVCRTKALMKEYVARFLEAEVEIRPIIAGNMTNQPFYKKYVKAIEACPNSDFIHAQGFYFGNNPEMTEKELVILEGLLNG